ncbi:Carbamoyl-phosphate synthase large chain, partial [human gut metagenome]
SILATTGTAQVLRRNGIPATPVRKLSEGVSKDGEQTIVGLIESGAVDMVVNTPKGQGARAQEYFEGLGWDPIFVEGNEPEVMHQLMAEKMDEAIEKILTIKKHALE